MRHIFFTVICILTIAFATTTTTTTTTNHVGFRVFYGITQEIIM
jgi:hypothetical protein